jgi:uncharacterized Zn finger protein (UPF0148 family)
VKQTKHFSARICQDCDREYVPTSGFQRYCPECGTEENRAYHAAYSATYRKTHPEKVKENNAKYYWANIETQKRAAKEWIAENPDSIRAIRRKRKATRRNLGFVPLNKPFGGCEAHHIDKERIVYIPKELHQSIQHNVFTGKNMDTINSIALAYVGA